MYSDIIICKDGPLEGQEVTIDRRMMRLYDTISVPEFEVINVGKRQVERKIPTGKQYAYVIRNDGLYYVGEQGS